MQESLVRWHQLSDDQRAEIRDPTAWLAKVVSRICLDQVKSARDHQSGASRYGRDLGLSW